MPARSGPISRGAELTPSVPRQRTAPRERSAELERRTPIRKVSAKRQAQNRLRQKVVAELFPDRPPCSRPDCPRWADDIHEPLTRARGGSIVEPENMRPLCRMCHDEVTFKPESELQWAYEIGLLRHSWDATAGEVA